MGNIYFGGTMDYNMDIYKVYAKIAKNPVGQVIIDAINGTKKDLTFVPYNKGKEALYGDNTLTTPDDPAAGAPEGVSRAGNAFGIAGKMIIHIPEPTSDMIWSRREWLAREMAAMLRFISPLTYVRNPAVTLEHMGASRMKSYSMRWFTLYVTCREDPTQSQQKIAREDTILKRNF